MEVILPTLSASSVLSVRFFTAIVVLFTFSDKLTFVSDLEPLCKIQTKRLGAIRENVEGDLKTNSFLILKKTSNKNLRSFPLHVGDEPFQKSGRLNLKRNPLQQKWFLLFPM